MVVAGGVENIWPVGEATELLFMTEILAFKENEVINFPWGGDGNEVIKFSMGWRWE